MNGICSESAKAETVSQNGVEIFAYSVSENAAEAETQIKSAAIVEEGTCGSSLTWTLDEEGCMIVSGTGDYDYFSRPWVNSNVKKVVLNINGITSTQKMFRGCWFLKEIDVSNMDTSNVTDMSHMFSGCSNLVNLDLSDFNTSKVTEMGNMFCKCSSLTNLNLSNFNTSNVTNMEDMFHICHKLISLDLSKFDMSKVTNARNMLFGCGKLVYIKAFENKSSVQVELPTWNVWYYQPTGQKVTHITKAGNYVVPKKKGDTFVKDNATYKVTKAGVKKGTVEYKGYKKKSSKTIKIPNTVTIHGVTYTVTSIGSGAFKNNKKVKTITIGKNVKTIGNSAFRNCTALTKITIPDKVTKIGKEVFFGCKKLKTITIKTKVLKSVGKNALKSVHKKCKVKVPKSKLKAYKKLFKNKGQAKTVKVIKY